MIDATGIRFEHSQLRLGLISAFEKVLVHGQLIDGPEVEQFEARLAKFFGTSYCVAVNSGTDAIKISLRAAGLRPGDEVITVANTFVGTVGAIVELGAVPVFADVDENSENMDVKDLESLVTSRTKAILPVHLRGLPADMKAILEFADVHSLFVIEDCAQGIGASIDGRSVGTFGVAGCISFHPQKSVGALGDGGAIVTNSVELASCCRLLRNHGLADRDHAEILGYNSRLDSIQAAFLLNKIELGEMWQLRRREIASFYTASWSELPIALPNVVGNVGHSAFHYVLCSDQRDELKEFLVINQVQALIHYPIPLHRQVGVKRYLQREYALPSTERLASRILTIPCHAWLTDSEVETVATLVSKYFH